MYQCACVCVVPYLGFLFGESLGIRLDRPTTNWIRDRLSWLVEHWSQQGASKEPWVWFSAAASCHFPSLSSHHVSLFWNKETEWKYTYHLLLWNPVPLGAHWKDLAYLETAGKGTATWFIWSPVLACLCLFSSFTPSWVFQVDLYSNQCLNSCLLARGVHSSLGIVCFQSPCMMRYNITWCHCIDQRMCGMQVNCPVGCSYQLPLFICFSLWETGL